VISLVRADLLKLQRRRGVWLSTVFLPAGFVLLIGMLGAFIDDLGVRGGGRFVEDAQFTVALMTTVVIVLIGARLGSDEHALQTFRYQVLSGRPRLQLYASKIGALLVIATLSVLVAVVTTILASFLPPAAPEDTVAFSDLTRLFWWLWLPSVTYGAIALGVGALLRASGGAITVSLLLQFIGLNLIALLANLWTGFKYLAIYGALDRLGPDNIDKTDEFRQSVTGAIICLLAIIALFLAAGLVRMLRSED